MPKPRKRKVEIQKDEPIKTVNLYGKPNRDKFKTLKRTQKEYNNALNYHTSLLCSHKTDIFFEILRNDYKNIKVSSIERDNKYPTLNSKLSQNAFFDAFVKLHNREKSIKNEISKNVTDFIVSSLTVYKGLICDFPKEEILGELNTYLSESIIRAFKTKQKDTVNYYKKIIKEVRLADIETLRTEVKFWHDSFSLEYKIPEFKNAPVKFDSALCSFSESEIDAPFVISLSNPFEKNKRYDVPLYTTKRGLQRLNNYKSASTFYVRVKDNGYIHVMVAVKKKVSFTNSFTTVNGVDTGIIDILYVSDGQHFGSFAELIDFYKRSVEPKQGYLSSLRNKKRCIRYYYQKHKDTLPQNIKEQLIRKMDNLDKMIKQNKVAKRMNNRYYQMFDQIIKKAVTDYAKTLQKGTLTAIELLDIKEFEDSKKANGSRSMFARGLLHKRLKEYLTWHGFSYTEVEPAYTSQVCPECFNLNKGNRNNKDFKCTCCGYSGDADHVGSINIGNRATDNKLKNILKSLPTHKMRITALREYYTEKHNEWLMQNNLKSA